MPALGVQPRTPTQRQDNVVGSLSVSAPGASRQIGAFRKPLQPLRNAIVKGPVFGSGAVETGIDFRDAGTLVKECPPV
jgi:hypothetical protein